jgi:NitT/TauT family transport system ATP-binding protein
MTSGALTNSVLAISDLKFAYAATTVSGAADTAIGDFSLTVNQGEIVSILGASGCGKSTLLNLIAGLLIPQSGQIQFTDQGGKQKIGYIFQDDALFPWRTVEGNLMLVRSLSRGTTETTKEAALERISQYLKTFHLDEQIRHKYPSQLSGGMRQRVSIIQSLMFDPQLLLLDEPFSALDFYTKLSLEGEFFELVKAQNKAAIFVTHDIEEAVAISDRVLLMKKGGELAREFQIDFGAQRSPENVRGTQQFADMYKSIWAELKLVIAQ